MTDQLLSLLSNCYEDNLDPSIIMPRYPTLGEPAELDKRYWQYRLIRMTGERTLGGHGAADTIEYVAEQVGLTNLLHLMRSPAIFDEIEPLFWRELSTKRKANLPVTLPELRVLLRENRHAKRKKLRA